MPMLDASETALLRAAAEAGEDSLPRLVYADWIEERGDAARAEFIRLQCEPPELPEIVQAVRPIVGRERVLLDSHRREWVAGFGVPVEDVAFERGLVSAVRLKEWDGGTLLDPAILPRFATLTELDLSGLQLTDDDLAVFVDTARFPRLRKLILSENALSDAGANRLAKATGMPKLDTAYVFGNSITTTGRAVLSGSSHFRLLTLDFGERADGYCMSRGEVELARRQFLRENLLPFVQEYFDKYELLQSAMLVVAQYWDDEAGDAVHGDLIVSELPEPVLRGATRFPARDGSTRADPNVPNTRTEDRYSFTGSVVTLWDNGWDENRGAIPLWAAFSPEGGHQEQYDVSEGHAPPSCSTDTADTRCCRWSVRTSTVFARSGISEMRSEEPAMLYLALSCFQGRPMAEAAEALHALAPGRVGLQLTPGCAPGPITVACPTRTHHGFTTRALRTPVWDAGALVWHGDSAHPPRERDVPDRWQPPADVILETMYPGYAALANGDQLAAAMDAGRWLAVDVAHLDIQTFHGLLPRSALNRLLEYERVAEVHVSTNREHRDSHAKLSGSEWGLEWARAKLAVGTPVVLECYMHKLAHEERLEQVAMLL